MKVKIFEERYIMEELNFINQKLNRNLLKKLSNE